MPSCERPRDDPQSQTDAMDIDFWAAEGRVDNGTNATNSVVTDRPRLPLPKTRIFGFLTYPMCLDEILRFCASEKVPRQGSLLGVLTETCRGCRWRRFDQCWVAIVLLARWQVDPLLMKCDFCGVVVGASHTIKERLSPCLVEIPSKRQSGHVLVKLILQITLFSLRIGLERQLGVKPTIRIDLTECVPSQCVYCQVPSQVLPSTCSHLGRLPWNITKD